MNKIKLSDKKARWAKNRDVALHGKRLNYNASIKWVGITGDTTKSGE